MMPRCEVHTTADGLRLAYRRWGAGPRTLVCVHGLLRNGRDFDALAAALAGSYTVICPDLIGHGDSDWDPRGRYGLRRWAGDVLGLIEELQLPEVDFLGTSLGGLIGLGVASRRSSPVARLVLNDAAPEVDSTALQELVHQARQAPLPFPDLDAAESFLRRSHRGLGALGEAQWRKFTRDTVREHGPGLRMHYDPQLLTSRYVLSGVPNLWDQYCAITCPVLALRGAESQVVSAAVAARMHAPPTTAVVEIAGRGHAPPLLSSAEIELVRGFLAEPIPQPLRLAQC